MDVNDLAFIAHNSCQHAATITAALESAGQITTSTEAGHAFAALREDVYNGALELMGTSTEQVQADAQAAAEAAAKRAEERAAKELEKGFGNGGSSSGRVKVRKQLDGHDIPDWLEKQVEWLVGKGEIPDADVIEVWDNRGYLPQFGGSRSERAAWFTAVEKVDGEKYGAGIWPPKKR